MQSTQGVRSGLSHTAHTVSLPSTTLRAPMDLRPSRNTARRRPGTAAVSRGLPTGIVRYGLSLLLAAPLVALVAGCGFLSKRDGPPSFSHLDPGNIQDAVPRVEAKSRYGNPPHYEVFGKRYYVSPGSKGYVKRGVASWYGRKFHGRRTSSGEAYDMYAMTAAHRSLPLPTYVRVINLENKRQAIVRVNDRGPFHSNRIIDLSYAAAVKLGVAKKGTAHVEIRAIDPSRWKKAARTAPPTTASAPARDDSGDNLEDNLGDNPEDRLYLQAGAFTDPAGAERLKARLSAAVDTPVRISTVPHQGRTLYRVRLGPFADADRANRAGETLAGLGLHGVRILAD